MKEAPNRIHDITSLLLPWLANGSLSHDEAQRIRVFSESEAGKAELSEVRAMIGMIMESHPSAVNLVNFAMKPDSLDEDLRVATGKHIDVCPSCSAEVLLVRRPAISGRRVGKPLLLSLAMAVTFLIVLGTVFTETLVGPPARPGTLGQGLESLGPHYSEESLANVFADGFERIDSWMEPH